MLACGAHLVTGEKTFSYSFSSNLWVWHEEVKLLKYGTRIRNPLSSPEENHKILEFGLKLPHNLPCGNCSYFPIRVVEPSQHCSRRIGVSIFFLLVASLLKSKKEK